MRPFSNHCEDQFGVDTQSEVPNTGSSRNSKRRNVFGRSVESSGSHETGENGKDVTSTPISYTSTKRDSVEDSPKAQRRTKRSFDNKSGDRRSLFGSAFGGNIGKTRKPPPRISAAYVFIENPTLICVDGPEPNRLSDREDDGKVEREKSTSAFSRLYSIGDRKSSISRHDVGEFIAKQVAMDRTNSPGDTLTKMSKEERARALLRKRGSGGETPKSPVPPSPSNGPGLVRGRSVIEQIGTPDFNGWLMKKGEHYNTWKNRYCILKGHNLYWMGNNDATVWTNSCLFAQN